MQIVKCATGGGKTVIFAAMLKALEKKNYPSLLLFRNKTLVTQTYDLLRKCGIEGIGRVNMYVLGWCALRLTPGHAGTTTNPRTSLAQHCSRYQRSAR